MAKLTQQLRNGIRKEIVLKGRKAKDGSLYCPVTTVLICCGSRRRMYIIPDNKQTRSPLGLHHMICGWS